MRDDPIGRYVLGTNYLMWTVTAHLGGLSLWGRGDEEVVRHSIDVFDGFEVSPMAIPAAFVLDASRLSAIEPLAFALLLESFARRKDLLRSRVDRAAIVVDRGLVASAVAGFLSVLGDFHSYQVLHSLTEAFDRLDHRDHQDSCAQIEQLLEASASQPPELRTLRAWIERNIENPSIEEASRSLGVSKRSLQRMLNESGTSFRAQLDSVRKAAAERMLLSDSLKLEAIAHQLGFSSLESFSIAFRRWHGCSPGSWRAARIPPMNRSTREDGGA